MLSKGERTAELIGGLYTQGLSYKQISRKVRLSYGTISGYISVMSFGFNSPTSYNKYKTGSKDISGRVDRVYSILQRGFLSETQYRDYMAEQRQKRPKNRAISSLIKTRLGEIGQTQSWLSREIGVSRQIVFLYYHGKRIPKKQVLDEIFRVLKVPYKKLEEIVA